MRVMQVSLDDVINMVAVRHGLVAAACAVVVGLVVPAAVVIGRARRGIRGIHGDLVLLTFDPSWKRRCPSWR